MNWIQRLASRVAAGILKLARVTAQVDDSPGYTAVGSSNHDRDAAERNEIYADGLSIWRKNPMAWRIVATITNFVLADEIGITSPVAALNRFIGEFWNHTKNHMSQRLDAMLEELTRAGDLFVVLFRNQVDGMSYIRFVTKDCITRIEKAENDWETELVYHERTATGERPWYSPNHPLTQTAEGPNAVMLHYDINRPIGADFGESDLVTIIPWLQRYALMLEDRVKLHWASRMFLWFVTVPGHMLEAKREQYKKPPETGSVVVKDDTETWEVNAPMLHGIDAAPDLRAVRYMVDAGSGVPPHWRGEPAETNLATAQAMQTVTERHLLHRQKYFTWMLCDILFHAYQRSVQMGMARRIKETDYRKLFVVAVPDVSKTDNPALAEAANKLASAVKTLNETAMPGRSKTLAKLVLDLVLKFAGEPQSEEVLNKVIEEAYDPRNANTLEPGNNPAAAAANE